MTGASDLRAATAAYVSALEGLTPETLPAWRALCAPDMLFRDPFNDAIGLDAAEGVFRKMFEDVSQISFRVLDSAVSGQNAYLRWRFDFHARGRDWTIEGMSEIMFDERARVVRHIDHWDAASQFYETIPLLGSLIRAVKQRLSAAPRS